MPTDTHKAERSERVAQARRTVLTLFRKYRITTAATAHEEIRLRMTQEDLDAYYAAKDTLMAEEAI